jgi:hypothetical protein
VYKVGDTCTVNVTFSPRYAWLRTGAVVLLGESGDVIATGYLHGVGEGAQETFSPATQSLEHTIGGSYVNIAVDGGGNVYYTEEDNGVTASSYSIVKAPASDPTCSKPSDCTTIKPAGATFASSDPYLIAMAVDGAGNVYAADFYDGQVVKFPWTGSGYGAASSVVNGLSYPRALAVDGNGALYIAESNNNVVKVSWTGSGYGTQSTVASGVKTTSIAVDGEGNVIIADPSANSIMKAPWTGSGYGAKSTILSLPDPYYLVVDGAGSLYALTYSHTCVTSCLSNLVKVPWTGSGFGTPITLATSLNYSRVAIDGSGYTE